MDHIHWRFVRIERVREILDAELTDGTEAWTAIERRLLPARDTGRLTETAD